MLPALVFAWFWHRFLGERTRSATLREAVFFSTMAGSSLFAYSLVFTSHAQNAMCFGAALMALATLRDRDREAVEEGRSPALGLGRMFLAGLFGAGCTLFEYPAAIATGSIALWILAIGAERRRALLIASALVAGAAGALLFKHHKPAGVAAGALAFALYLGTVSWRSLARLALAGIGGAIPTGLTLLYHKRCFGDPFKPGYSYLENAQFREETNQGFFGATHFAWEAGLRLWLDPAFGLIPSTAVFMTSLVGFGAYLAGELPADPAEARRAKLRRDVASAVIFALTMLCAVKGVLAARAHAHAHAALHEHLGPWVAAFAAGLIALSALRCAPPARADRSFGATMLLACIGLSHLIGMMNNWRGGWQVGPRYLSTLIPALGIAALAGLEALSRWGDPSRPNPVARRVATVFAAGATLTSILITGGPSAWFPHVPLEYSSPFFEMMLPLVRAGFVPHNAGHLMHLHGLASMGAFFAASAVIAALVLTGDERRPLAALAHCVAGLAVTALLLAPLALAAKPESAPVTRYVKSAFEPQPPAVTPARATAAAAPREPAAALNARARRFAEDGEGPAAMELYLRAMQPPR